MSLFDTELGYNPWNRPGLASSPLATGYSVAGILREVCERVGIPERRANLQGVEGLCDGYAYNPSDGAFTVIEGLGQIFLFDPASFDGQVHFVQRGLDPVAVLTSDDLVSQGRDDAKKLDRKDSITIPRVLHLEYHDVEGGLSPNKQTSDRSLDSRATAESKIETKVVMRAADAAKSVVINHKVSIEDQRGEWSFSLPDSYLELACGDVILLDGERLRITEIEFDEGQQNYKATYDRQSAYSSTIQGVPVQPPIDPPTLIIGNTVLQFIDSHILRDADDRLGYYVAVAGESTAWTGALVELSVDGGENYIDSVEAQTDADMGELLAPLPAHSRYYPDDVNTLSVQMLRDDMLLESADLAGMQNRLNLAIVGDELINFGDVSDAGEAQHDLTNLLRGRKGSPISEHPAGTRFVILDRSQLWFIDAELFELGRDLTFRVTSFGADQSNTVTATFTGQSQRERAPVYLQAQRSGGDIAISWQGVGRLGGGAQVAQGAYFTGFRVTVNGAAQDTTASQLTVADPGGTVTIQVQQLNQLTGAGPAAEITL